MTSHSTQKKLIIEKNLTLQRAIDIATAAEMAILDHPQELAASVQSEVHSVSYTKLCNVCGKLGHTGNRCKFRALTCYKCGQQGHLQAVCRDQGKPPIRQDTHGVKQLEQVTEQTEEMTIWTITGGLTEGYQVHLKLNNKPTKMKLDTLGEAVSVMSHQQWSRMFGDTRTLEVYQGKPLQGYVGHKIQVIGQVKVDVEYGNQKKQLPLILVAGNERPPLVATGYK